MINSSYLRGKIVGLLKVKITLDVPMQLQERGGGTAPNLSQNCNLRIWVVSTKLRSFYPQERPGNHSTGSWVGRRGRSGIHGRLLRGPMALIFSP